MHVIAKNRLTQYMGPASAYQAVLRSIDQDATTLISANPEIFTFGQVDEGVVHIRDFQTAGVVAFARGCPLYAQRPGRLDVMGKRASGQGLPEQLHQGCPRTRRLALTPPNRGRTTPLKAGPRVSHTRAHQEPRPPGRPTPDPRPPAQPDTRQGLVPEFCRWMASKSGECVT